MSEENKQETVETVETKEQGQSLTIEDVQKMIQSETDKVRTEYSKKVKDLEKEKEAIKKEKMTEEEKAQYEIEQYKQQLSEKEKAIQERELNIQATDLLKENELPLDFRPFLVGKDEESTTQNIESFKSLWIKTLNEQVDQRFKNSGRTVNTKEDNSKVDPIADAFAKAFKN